MQLGILEKPNPENLQFGTLKQILEDPQFTKKLREVGRFTLRTGREAGFDILLSRNDPRKFSFGGIVKGSEHSMPPRPVLEPLEGRERQLRGLNRWFHFKFGKVDVIQIHTHSHLDDIPSPSDIQQTRGIRGVVTSSLQGNMKLLLWQYPEYPGLLLENRYKAFPPPIPEGKDMEDYWAWPRVTFENMVPVLKEDGPVALLYLPEGAKRLVGLSEKVLSNFSLELAFYAPYN